MFEVEIDRSICKGCGACTKASQILYLDDDNLVNMQGAAVRLMFPLKSNVERFT